MQYIGASTEKDLFCLVEVINLTDNVIREEVTVGHGECVAVVADMPPSYSS